MAIRTYFVDKNNTWACSVGVHIRESRPKKRKNRYQTGFKTKEKAEKWGKMTEKSLFNYLKRLYPKRYPETYEESQQNKDLKKRLNKINLDYWENILRPREQGARAEKTPKDDPYLEQIRELEAEIARLKSKQMVLSFNQ